MAQALAEGRFRPHYQPKVRLADAGLIGLEAVARWDHPDRGLLTPDHFLDTLHQLGLQGDYMAATLAQVLADVEQMLAQGHSPGEVSVNMPEVALATQAGRAELLGLVTSHPQAARHLTIEITEDVFIARSADAIRSAVADLRDRGLRISLDNFGTGFASFQHLRQLQFDEIKIGAPFVTDLGRDPAAEVLVKGTLDIAAGLRVQVVAEGIEAEAQRQTLIALGASLGQGALFGRALPLAETMLRMTTERMRVPFEPLVPPRSRQTSDRGGRATAV
jgi:EAL domain-containing protein (putative c-di-GMP-specific phosphodiesterase class I)